MNSSLLLFIVFLIDRFKLISSDTPYSIPKPEKKFKSFFDTDVELFLPKYDFQRPYKFQKKSYSKLYQNLQDTQSKAKDQYNLDDTFVFPNEYIKETEDVYKNEILNSIIKREVNIEDIKLTKENDVYGSPEARFFEDSPRLHKDEDLRIKDFAEMGNLFNFEPKVLQINDKPLCIPTMVFLHLKNGKTKPLILKSIKSDLYQVTIFFFKGKDSVTSFNQKSLYPKTINPGETLILQIIILPDMLGDVKGNIYFELMDNKIILYPIKIRGIQNIYKMMPIYSPSWPSSKLLTLPITIYNPHEKVLIIKEVINSFSSINLVWPNGQPVSSNQTAISTSMLEVSQKSSKILMNINFYKEVPGVEYGLLQIKTDKDTLIIPVLIKVEVQSLKTYPSTFDFGVIDLNQNIKRMIPISIMNTSKNPIQLKSMYTLYEENLIEFIPRSNYTMCQEDDHQAQLEASCSNCEKNKGHYYKNLCILKPGENYPNFGYLMIDPNNLVDSNDLKMHKKFKGTIVLQNNFTENTFTYLSYSYILDKNTFIYSEKNFEFFLQKNIEKELIFESQFRINPSINFLVNGISTATDDFSIHFDKNYQKSLNNKFNFTITDPSKFINKKNYFFLVKSIKNSISLIPFKIFEKIISLGYCDSFQYECEEQNVTYLDKVNIESQQLNIDFGMVSTSEPGKKMFQIYNDNPVEIIISNIEISSPYLNLNVESITSINKDIQFANDFSKVSKALKYKVKEKSKDEISIALPRNSITNISIIVSSSVEQEINGTIKIYFNSYNDLLNKTTFLTIYSKAKVIKGNLNITPSIIRFEPAFPGLFQTKLISSKSSYNIPISVKSFKSHDHRFTPILLTNTIISNNRTEILKIVFDPSKVQTDENFMRGDFMNSTTKYLTYKELYLWKEKQKLWEILGSQGRTEINTSVNIKTNIQKETVNVRGFLTKPSLVKKDEVDFKLIQIGDSSIKYIEVINPSDEPISLQVLLAPEEFSDIHNNTMFTKNKKFRFSPSNTVMLMDCHFINSTHSESHNNFTQNLLYSNSKPKSKKKRKYEGDNLNLNEYQNLVLLEEELTQQNLKSNSKPDLLKKIFLFSSNNVKASMVASDKIICNSNVIKKNDIISNNYHELMDKIFSDEFGKEIFTIKKMTDSTPPASHRHQSHYKKSFFEKMAYYLKLFFKMETPVKKRTFKTTDDTVSIKKQEFFLPKVISNQVYHIKPHARTKIGPIIYHPTNFSQNSATLFLKNNLTILYPLKLKGTGGSGIISFSINEEINNSTFIKEKKIEKLNINLNSSIFNDKTIYSNDQIVKTIKIKNEGNLPLKVKNVSIENSGCDAFGLQLTTCEGFQIAPSEYIKLNLTIKPDFNFYYIEKNIVFITQYQKINLNVHITISNELLSIKNRLFRIDNLSGIGLISCASIAFVALIICYIILIEYRSINENNSNVKNNVINFVSSKVLIETNPVLKFENLFIKSYRRYNQNFYEDFINKGTFDVGIEYLKKNTTSEKKISTKEKMKIEREKEKELENKDRDRDRDSHSEISTKEREVKKSTNEEKHNRESNTITRDKASSKKTYDASARVDKRIDANKPRSKKQPIGIGKREDDYQSSSSKPYNQASTNKVDNNKSDTNKLDNNKLNNNNIDNSHSGTPLNKYEAPYYHSSVNQNNASTTAPNSSTYNEGSYVPTDSIYYNNQTSQPYYPKNSYAYPNPYNKFTNNQQPATSYNNKFPNATPVTDNSSSFVPNTSQLNFDSKPFEFKKDKKEDKDNKDNKLDNKLDTSNNKEVEKETIKESKSAELRNTNNSNKNDTNNNKLEDDKNQINYKEKFMNFNNDNENNAESIENTPTKQEAPQSKFNLDGFKNFDFGNVFTKENLNETESINQNADNKKESASQINNLESNQFESENDDYNNFRFKRDGDLSSNYQSEVENKLVEDSCEEFSGNKADVKFNFNSIFGNVDKPKMMAGNSPFAPTESASLIKEAAVESEAEESNNNYMYNNGLYFNNNLFNNFYTAFKKPDSNSFFTNVSTENFKGSNPFASDHTKKSALSELRDDDEVLREEQEELKDKVDDAFDIEEEDDDEEDPQWDNTDIDLKKEGFFDESGIYKMKQLDFNFIN